MTVPTAAVDIGPFQLPVTPLLDVLGKMGGVEFWQSAGTGVKAGVTVGVMTTCCVNEVAQALLGVKT